MAIEATPIEPQEVTNSPRHQNLADQIEQGFTGLWKWVEQFLPNHDTHKPNALNNIKQGYDNAIAAIKADAEETARKLADEARQAAQTAEQGAESAVQDAAGAVVESNAGAVPQTPTTSASDQSTGTEGTSSGTTSAATGTGTTDTPTS